MTITRFPFHAGTRLDAKVFGQEEITARHTEVDAQIVGRLPEVRPEDACQSRIVLRFIIRRSRHWFVHVLGRAEAQVEETV